MRVLLINVVCGIGSTGRICTDLAQDLESRGHEVKIAYGRGIVPEPLKKYAVKIGTEFDVRLHGIKARLWDASGFGSKNATKKLIQWIEVYNPDVIHLHNIHGYYLNIKILFQYLKTIHKPIIWTLHDAWTMTGHCAVFSEMHCEKWRTGCGHCQYIHTYPKSLFIDRSRKNWQLKKKYFSGIQQMTLVTPSQWLADLTKEGFMGQYPIKVIHNGIDTNIFCPRPSNFREKYGIHHEKFVLGVASVWVPRKGLDDFIKLWDMRKNQFKLVLVGLTKKQMKIVPKGIICIERTNSPEELAEIYSTADVFLNLTYDDNYPTTNLEAQACGTPCITYRTGGSVESVPSENVVEQGDIKGVLNLINHKLRISDIPKDKQVMMDEYLKLYL